MLSRRTLSLALASLVVTLSVGCKAAQYQTLEWFGVQKRDLLVDRVQDGRKEQAAAQEQFQTTFETLKELSGFEGGDLEDKYDTLSAEYDRCVDAARDVRARIDSIQTVSDDLFEEWDEEIEEISSAELRASSKDLLSETKSSSEGLLQTMNSAADRMDPVLSAFKDQVLFLKHNLNAQAIASLENNVVEIESDIETLIAEMQTSIEEADAFIDSMTN